MAIESDIVRKPSQPALLNIFILRHLGDSWAVRLIDRRPREETIERRRRAALQTKA